MQIVDATVADIPRVQRLAGIIWRAHYPGIISHEQIEYMLERGYSTEALMEFLGKPDAGLLLAVAIGEQIGFAAWYAKRATEAKLDKLYVLQRCHGQGVGQALIERVADQARAVGATTLILQVNKANTKAIAAYRRSGFSVRDAIVNDIGSGFVMDDFVMARSL